MKPFAYRIKLGDTDAAGRLYFAAAFRIAHDAFEEGMDTIGLPVAGMIKEGKVGFPVVHADATYARPVNVGDTVFVTTMIKKVGNSSVHFQHEIKCADGHLAIKVNLIHVTVSAKIGKTIKLPPPFRRALTR
jgi:1,4-dihydroxy-2-naphthoyl-CoA hydrolase